MSDAAVNFEEMDVAIRRDEGIPLSGVATREDRYFIFRTLSAMSTTGLGLRDVLGRMAAAMDGALDATTATGTRRKALVDSLLKAVAPGKAEASTKLYDLFDDRSFVLSGEERCLLSITYGEATPQVVTAVLAAASEFVGGQARR